MENTMMAAMVSAMRSRKRNFGEIRGTFFKASRKSKNSETAKRVRAAAAASRVDVSGLNCPALPKIRYAATQAGGQIKDFRNSVLLF